LTDTDQDPAFVDFFKTTKKKDYLADALLRCITFLSITRYIKAAGLLRSIARSQNSNSLSILNNLAIIENGRNWPKGFKGL
jgi:hypothetical protein